MANPELTVNYPEGLLYDATEAGAIDALINLKLSRSAQFADKAGGCALAQSAAAADGVAARRLPECAER